MVSIAARFTTTDEPRASLSAALVADYREAHATMLDAIDAMDELTREDAPNPLRLSHTRLRITRASFECRTLFRKITVSLSHSPTPTVARTVATLQQHHSDLFVLTSAHLAAWSPPQIQSDWLGYRRSSDEVRGRWREIIEHERKSLYPLLDLRTSAQANAAAFLSN